MISPAAKKKLPWKTYGLVLTVWFVLMVPVAWSMWGSGPNQIQKIEGLQNEPGISPGLAQDVFLDAGVHGIWLTRPAEADGYVPLEAFRIVGPAGSDQKLYFPPGESVTITTDDKNTIMAAVFRATQPGYYSLYIDPEYVVEGEARYGPAWEDGQIINSSRGVGALIAGWVITVSCATFALRKTVRSSPEQVE